MKLLDFLQKNWKGALLSNKYLYTTKLNNNCKIEWQCNTKTQLRNPYRPILFLFALAYSFPIILQSLPSIIQILTKSNRVTNSNDLP